MPSDTHHTTVPWVLFIFIVLVFAMSDHKWMQPILNLDDSREMVELRASSVEEGRPVRRAAIISLGLVGALSIAVARRRGLSIQGVVGWSMAFLAIWALLSLLWTVDVSLTTRRLVSFFSLCLGALAVSRKASPRDIAILMACSSLVFLLAGIASEVAFGSFEPLNAGDRFGGTLPPNAQGLNCAFLLLSAFFLADSSERRRWVFWSMAGAGFLFLILTKSRTAFACALLAIAAYKSMTARKNSRIRAIFLAAILAIALFLMLGEAAVPFLSETVLLGRTFDEGGNTLQGRYSVWGECLSYVAERPFLGYGFRAFWRPSIIEDISSSQGWQLGSSHSVYIDLALDLGIIGLLLYLIMLGAAVWKSRSLVRLSGKKEYAFSFAFLCLNMSQGLLESTFLREGYFAFIALVILAVLGFRSPVE